MFRSKQEQIDHIQETMFIKNLINATSGGPPRNAEAEMREQQQMQQRQNTLKAEMAMASGQEK